MAAGVGDSADALGRQLVECSAGRVVGAERPADGVGVGQVEVIGQLALGGLHHVVVPHDRPGLGEVVEGVHGAAVAAAHDLLRLLALAQRGQRAACCGCIFNVDAVGLLHCPGKHSGLLRADLLHDGVHLLDEIGSACTQCLRAEHLPLSGGGDPPCLEDTAHHVPEDALAQLIPRGREQAGVAVYLFRRQHGVTVWRPPLWATWKPSSSVIFTAS